MISKMTEQPKCKEWGVFSQSVIASVVDKKITFAGEVYKPDAAKAFIRATMCHSLPTVNSARRGWTAATIANSINSAKNQLVDFEHRLEFYRQLRSDTGLTDEICGTIVAVSFPPKEQAVALSAEGTSVPVEVLLALHRKAAKVSKALEEIASEDNPWRLSLECEYNIFDSALWDGGAFFPIGGASNEMKQLVKYNTVDAYNGKQMALICGGEDGNILFSGVALTCWPRDKNAGIQQLAASEESNRAIFLSAGWKSEKDIASATNETGAKAWDTQDAPDKFFAYVPVSGNKSDRKFPLASVEKKGIDPAILRNALARFSQADLPANAKTAVLNRIKGAIRTWNDANPKDVIDVSSEQDCSEFANGNALSYCSRLGGGSDLWKESHMKVLVKDVAASLHKRAVEIKDVDAMAAGKLEACAVAIEKEVGELDTEAVIEARIASGDLVPKAKVEELVKAAKLLAVEEFKKEMMDEAKAKEQASAVLSSRLEQVKAAKLDPAFTLAKDRTIASVVASIPVTKDGEQLFTERLEEWVALRKTTGQALASDESGKTKPAVGLGGNGSGSVLPKMIL